jgi:hypothetical protein
VDVTRLIDYLVRARMWKRRVSGSLTQGRSSKRYPAGRGVSARNAPVQIGVQSFKWALEERPVAARIATIRKAFDAGEWPAPRAA